MKILVDMDGVLCDFKKGVREGILSATNHNEELFPQSRIGFFAYLPPIEGAIEAMKLMQEKHEMYICSRPSFPNVNCYTEKAVWIRKHLGYEMQKKLMLMPDKSMALGDVLIDDMTADGQLNFTGQFVHFGTELWPDWNAVLQNFYYNS